MVEEIFKFLGKEIHSFLRILLIFFKNNSFLSEKIIQENI